MAREPVGGLDDPVWAESAVHPPLPAEHTGPPRAAWTVLALAILVIGIFLGYLGWLLPVPGASLLYPSCIVFGVGVAIAIVGWVIGALRKTDTRRVVGFSFVVVALSVAATVWTLDFSLPAAVTLPSGPLQQARAALSRAEHGPKNQVGSPLRPCRVVTSGAVGPIGAPYRVCALWTDPTHMVTLSAVGSHGGLAYLDGPSSAAYFPDECSRRLTGSWWMYTTPTNGIGSCPVGYSFHGGG